MKKKIFVIISLIFTAFTTYAVNLIAGSFNVLGTYRENHEFSDERLRLAAKIVAYHDFDVFGTQETQYWQIQGLLKSGIYNVSGVNVEGQIPTSKNRWTNAIFYKKDKYELIDSGAFFLTKTPDEKSKATYWKEKQYRNCNWVKLKDKISGKEFYFFNTHFGLNSIVRLHSAKLFVERIKQITKGLPFFTAGDYNTRPTETATIKALLESGILFDSWKVSEMKPYGPGGSFVNMLYNRPINGVVRDCSDANKKIDYIFVSKHIKVKKCAVIADNIGGAYPSDHLPLAAYLEF